MGSSVKIQILVDNPKSWFVLKVKQLQDKIAALGYESTFVERHEDVKPGDILFLLSCESKYTRLNLNRHNLVVHASDLPKGKGWSPLTWQVLEGKNVIPVTLFEAAEKIDSGVIYLQDNLQLSGTELIDELRVKLYESIEKLVLRFVAMYPNCVGRDQMGEESIYKRRRAQDSELDVNKSLAEQFNLLRIVDNDKYPAFFYYKDKKFLLKIIEAEVEKKD